MQWHFYSLKNWYRKVCSPHSMPGHHNFQGTVGYSISMDFVVTKEKTNCKLNPKIPDMKLHM
jgi:hypothetical protein